MLELHRLGATPSVNLVDVSLKRALIAASMSSPVKLEHLAPLKRHSVVELMEKWGAGIDHFAEQRLKPEDAKPEAKEAAA